ncbi:hypothetical protein [Nonomuraea sp. bgisy101]|uniref:hypothetical protein n=1 Tax=Nonomuraea sp. bgisy101 TaxID=3413784 RepID=UPI003D72460C
MNETRRHTQQRAFALAANLLTLPMPEVFTWDIRGGDNPLSGLLYRCPTLDETRLALHVWAVVFDAPVWTVRPHPVGRTFVSVTGIYRGLQVEIWNILDIAEIDVDELSTPPAVDLPASAQEVTA